MMMKTTLAVLILSVLSATEASTLPEQCTVEDIGGGETVKNCTNGTITMTNSDGGVEETIVFSNDSLELVQFPDSADCYIARGVHFPDGFSGRIEQDMESVEADEDLSNEMKALAPDQCTGTIFDLVQGTEELVPAGRRKRECGYIVRVIVITRYYIINGQLVRRRYVFLIRQKKC